MCGLLKCEGYLINAWIIKLYCLFWSPFFIFKYINKTFSHWTPCCSSPDLFTFYWCNLEETWTFQSDRRNVVASLLHVALKMIKRNVNKYFPKKSCEHLKNIFKQRSICLMYSRGHSASLLYYSAAAPAAWRGKKILVLKLEFAEMKYSVCVFAYTGVWVCI